MTARDNKRLAETYCQAWSHGDEPSLSSLLDDDFHYNDPSGVEGDKAAYLAFTRDMHRAFPDARLRIDKVIAEGEDVTVQWHADGTQRAAFLGVPASGRPVSIDGLSLLRIRNGKVQEDVTQADMLGLMQQIGAVPSPDDP